MGKQAIHVSLVVVPDATVGTVTGLYEALTLFETLVPSGPRFVPETVATSHHLVSTSCGLPFHAHKTLAQVPHTDIVILPSLLLESGRWQTGSRRASTAQKSSIASLWARA